MAIKTRKRKKTTTRSRKTGFAAIKTDSGYTYFKRVAHFEVDSKECSAVIKSWVRKNYDKTTASAILKNEEWRFNKSHIAAYCYWTSLEDVEPAPDDSVEWMTEYFAELAERGKSLVKEQKKEEKKKANVHTPSIQERMREQLSEIVGQFEVWLDEQPTKDVPKFFDWLKKNNVAQAHISKIREYYVPMHAEFEALLQKDCDPELKEGYGHLTKAEIKQHIKWFESLFTDLDAYNNLKRATRKTRVKKAPSTEKLVSKLKYKKDDARYKIVSIDPAKIVGATELWVFNTKNRKLGKYVAEDGVELTVKGTTLQFFDANKSVCKTLRKPEEQLAAFGKAGKVALRKFLEEIKATETKMNGRLNEHTVLLKVS